MLLQLPKKSCQPLREHQALLLEEGLPRSTQTVQLAAAEVFAGTVAARVVAATQLGK